MKKILSTILISFVSILGIGFLPAQSVLAANLTVQFENNPLFSEASIAPGASVTRFIKVTNDSGSTQKIAIEAINKTDPDNFGSKLNLLIKEGEDTRYNNTLKNFFDNGETYLSDLGAGVSTQYDLTISFDSGADDTFQGKNLGFDLIIGFQGQEGTGGGGSGGGGGGGIGQLPPGLTIPTQTVAVLSVEQTSVTISWTTSYNSSSQIIYAVEGEQHTLDLSDSLGTPPLYGYAHTTAETDVSPKVTNHTVTITGLAPGTTYYFRAVSHASLAISEEHVFITSSLEQPSAPTITPQPNQTTQPENQSNPEQGTNNQGQTIEPNEGGVVVNENGQAENQGNVIQPQVANLSLLANIGKILSLGTNNILVAIIFWLAIAGLVVWITLIISKKRKKKRNQNNQQINV